MPTRHSFKRSLAVLCGSIAFALALIACSIIADRIPYSAARPPDELKTIGDFRGWKQAEILGQGTYQHAGKTYTVLLGPAGRYLSSGPSAYLFDEQGQFVDWTSDMGDFSTQEHGFPLMSGEVKNIEWARK